MAGYGKPTFYNNPGCPFSHRADLTLAVKGIEHDAVLIPLSGELKRSKRDGVDACMTWADTDVTADQMQEIKDNYKKDVNSTGEVPTLVLGDHIVTEADVISEFIDDAFPGNGPRLFPTDPFERAQVRHWHKILSGNLGVSAHYSMLMNQDPAKDEEKREKLYKGLEKFCELADDEGPFFLGEEISFADIMLAPFYDRFRYTLQNRGVDLIPTDREKYPWAARFSRWACAIESHPAFQKTAGKKELYLTNYESYLGDRGHSEFGK